MPSLASTELIIIGLIALIFALPLAVVYRRGGSMRALLFWAAIILLLPVFGAVAALIFHRPAANAKRELRQ